MIPYFKSIDLEPARVAALLFAVIAVAVQFGWHLTDPQLESIKSAITVLVGLFGAAEMSRRRSVPTGKAEAIATEAFLSDKPASVAAAAILAKDMVATPAPKKSIPPVALGVLAFLLASCTPSQTKTATQIVDVSGVACEVIVSVVAPADAGLCVTGDELGNAIIAVLGSVQGQALAKTADGKIVVPEPVFARLNANQRIRARRVKQTPCAKGTVSP